MRWDRLFADLEASVADDEAAERDVVADELTDEEWSGLSSRDLIWGQVEVEVRPTGWLAGRVDQASDDVIVLETGARGDVLIARQAIVAWRGGQGRADTGVVAARLGWRHLLRAARDEGDRLNITRTDGAVLTGSVSAVTADAVSLDDGAGGTWLRYDAIALVRIASE